MSSTDNTSLITRPIQRLRVSSEFKAMAKANNYRTLQDVLHGDVSLLPEKKQSGYRILRELLDLLQEHDLMDLIKDE